MAMPDYLDLPDFNEVIRSILDWEMLEFRFIVHGEEFSSFHPAVSSESAARLQLRPQEKYLYSCGAIDLSEWERRLLGKLAE
jgi:hypothetical protein